METYLVGGAIRDALLGLEVKERDWVVIGTDEIHMQEKGFVRVGKEFPVFLHPDTHEEYALARTERKVAPGYQGFECRFDANVTLEEDLKRRDLTINAMAQKEDGTLIDPFGGQAHLKARVLCHVSEAFVEDPVRILRVARFASRFAPLGFTIDPKTIELMKQMVNAGEVDHLVADRIWKELGRALAQDAPEQFIQVLRQVGALKVILPELDKLYGIPQPEKWHPEVDTGVHMEMALRQSAQLTRDPVVRFAAMVHDVGKGCTPKSSWPQHHGHESKATEKIEGICQRLKVPNLYRDLAILVGQYHGLCHQAHSLKASTLVTLLEKTDAFRRPKRFNQFLLACQADALGRKGFENRAYTQKAFLEKILKIASHINIRILVDESGLKGEALKKLIHQERSRAVKDGLLNMSDV